MSYFSNNVRAPERAPNTWQALGMSFHPFHPAGFGQHCSAVPGRHLGQRITFDALPADCQRLVLQCLSA